VLAGCAANPHVVKVNNGNERMLNCTSLASEIEGAQHYKKESRKDDRFQLRYMMPVNAIVSVWNINRAEMAAVKRLKLLNQISSEKGCNGARVSQAFSPGAPIRNSGGGAYRGQMAPSAMQPPMPMMGMGGQANMNNGMYAAPAAPLQVNNGAVPTNRYRPRNNPNAGNQLQTEALPWQRQPQMPVQQMRPPTMAAPIQPQMPVARAPQREMGTMPGGIGSGGFGSPDDVTLAERAFSQGGNPSKSEIAEMERTMNIKGMKSPTVSGQASPVGAPQAYSKELEEKMLRESASPYGSAPQGMTGRSYDPSMSGF